MVEISKEEIAFQKSLDNWTDGPCFQIILVPGSNKSIQDFEDFLARDESNFFLNGVSRMVFGKESGKVVLILGEKLPPLGMIYFYHHEMIWMSAYPRQVKRILGGYHYSRKNELIPTKVESFLRCVFSFLKRMWAHRLITEAILVDEIDSFSGDWPRGFPNGIVFCNWLNDYSRFNIDQAKSSDKFAFIPFENC